MRWPSYGRGIARALLKGSLAELQPPASAVYVLLDEKAAAVAAAPVEAALETVDAPGHVLRWEAAEANKTLGEVERLAREIVRLGVDRQSLVVALGGGVTTDVGGFLAATLLRGLRWGAVPTTLLGMVDAALGGKTAVDLPEGKNLLGVFHQPEFILCDVDLLATLPEREWNCGLGEVLKTAVIGNPELLALLEDTPVDELRAPSEAALGMARSAGELKMRIVEEDPLEHGPRKVLNLGHTFGHALETAAGHSGLAHGEAVALGLLCAVRLSEEMGIAEGGLGRRLRSVLARLQLATAFPGPLPSESDLSTLLKRDKKARGGKLDLILPARPGECLLIKGVDPVVAVSVIHRELGG